MALLKYFLRLRKLDDLIDRKATGTPNELARKMNLSRSVLMSYLRDMKELDFPIKFSKTRNSYFYDESVEHDKLIGKLLSKETQSRIKGGFGVLNFSNLEILYNNNCKIFPE